MFKHEANFYLKRPRTQYTIPIRFIVSMVRIPDILDQNIVLRNHRILIFSLN